MVMLKKLKSALAGIVAGSMLATTSSLYPVNNAEPDLEANAASVCTINTNKLYQSIDGFGGINHPEWYGDLTDADRKLAFGNGEGQLGCSILRIFVNPDKNQWNKALPTAQYASKNGITVFASPWEPPSNLAENGSAYGGKLHLPKKNYGAYAQHLNDFGTYMKNNGVDLYSVSVQNEPDYAKEWTAWTPDETTDFIANYGDMITSTRLMSPESFQYGAYNNGKDYYSKILNNQKAWENCDIFGTHFYGTPRSKMDFPQLENCGKKLWMTEVYVPDSNVDANKWPDNLEQAVNIHDALVVGGMQAYVVWPLRRNYSIIYESTHSISKRGYIFGQFSKFVRPGDYRIDATESPTSGVSISAYKHSDTQIQVVAINKNVNDYAQEFSISGRTITNIDRYRTSENENLAKTNNLDHSTSSFFAQLPKNSVSTFIITLESDGKDLPKDPNTHTTEPDEPDANGYYFHDTFEGDIADWTGRGSAEVTLSGRSPYADKEALLVQNRESSWNGAQKALSTITYKPGEEYSFSVCATFLDSETTSQKIMLSLQYKDSSGTTQYGHIADATAVKGNYVQLANTNYKIPEGASDLYLYVETESGTDNFYIDEAIVAVKGTKINGPAEIKFTLGDINSDGVIDSFDLVLLRRGLINGFKNTAAALAADVNQDSKNDIADAVVFQKYLLRQIANFNQGSSSSSGGDEPTETMSMEAFTKLISANIRETETSDSRLEKSGVQYGTIKNGTYYSTTCNRNKPYYILLPANYDESKKYPVLYVMHGYWENERRMILDGNNGNAMCTRQIIGNAIAEGEAKDMIVVFPYIYSSATQASCSAMDDANNAAYDNFINDLTKDLMPHIEKTYSVKTGKNNTAITGFSMGGRESLLIGMKLSDKFGYIGAICPAPGVTGSFKWDSGKEPYLVFITAGSNDQTVYTVPNGYHESFTKNGVPHIWHYVNGGAHGDNSIHPHLYNFVRAVFKAA
ncbi:MAG: carbohydrate binding domain-containing protein [Ruminococcus sp.]|nr:carbohydrate binding domain-containing protein [Ruminococcus sp.]